MVFGKRHTGVSIFLIVGSSLDESNAFVHLYWQGEKNSTKSYKAREGQHQQIRLWTKPTPSSMCIDEEFILTIFCIISLAPSVGTFAKPYSFPFYDKRIPLNTRWIP